MLVNTPKPTTTTMHVQGKTLMQRICIRKKRLPNILRMFAKSRSVQCSFELLRSFHIVGSVGALLAGAPSERLSVRRWFSMQVLVCGGIFKYRKLLIRTRDRKSNSQSAPIRGAKQCAEINAENERRRWTGFKREPQKKEKRKWGAKQQKNMYVRVCGGEPMRWTRISLIGSLCNRRWCYYLLATGLAVLLVWWSSSWSRSRCPCRCCRRSASAP